MTTPNTPGRAPARGGTPKPPGPQPAATSRPGTAACAQDTPADPDDHAKLPYGVAADGRLTHISDVASGLGCNCHWAHCRDRRTLEECLRLLATTRPGGGGRR